MSTIYQLMKKQSGDKSLKTAIPTAYPRVFNHRNTKKYSRYKQFVKFYLLNY